MKVAIAVPLGATIPARAFNAFMAIAQRGWPMLQREHNRTDDNRNHFGKSFLADERLDYLLMLDADQIHPPDIVERMMRWVVDDPAKLVVGSLNYRRGTPWDPMAWILAEDGLYHHPVETPQGIFACDAMAHGTLLIHRSVLTRLEYPWWRYNYDISIDEESASEDIYFCKSCRAAGIQLWCDGTHTSPHLRYEEIGAEHFEQYMADHPEEFSIMEVGQEVA